MPEYWKMTKKKGMGIFDYYIFPLDNLDDAIYHMDDSPLGTKWIFEVIEMSVEEFEDLEEFSGW